MRFIPRIRSALGGLLLLGANAVLHAQGSPPFGTDDPGTPGDGRWEITLGLGTEKRAGSRLSGLPFYEFIYGVGDRLQVLYAGSHLHLRQDGIATESGLGNSLVGVKWRFCEVGERGLSVSIHPQLEFNTPGSNSDQRGLVGSGTLFALPLQFEQAVGPVRLIGQVGREFHPDDDSWFYGIAVSHRFTENTEVGFELTGGGSTRLHRTALTANVGIAIDLSESISVLFSLGRELHNHNEPRATLVGYLGVQWRL
jgi:hypothetical protein